MDKNNENVIKKQAAEIKELKNKLKKAEGERNNAKALLELKKRVDQLLQDTCLEKENQSQDQ